MQVQVQAPNALSLFGDLFQRSSYLDPYLVPGSRRIRRFEPRQLQPAVPGTTDEDGNFTFSLDVPGIPPEAISCELVEDLLTVKGEHEGRSLDRIYRVNADKVSAKYENGVLKLTLKATPKQKPLQIPVTVA